MYFLFLFFLIEFYYDCLVVFSALVPLLFRHYYTLFLIETPACDCLLIYIYILLHMSHLVKRCQCRRGSTIVSALGCTHATMIALRIGGGISYVLQLMKINCTAAVDFLLRAAATPGSGAAGGSRFL